MAKVQLRSGREMRGIVGSGTPILHIWRFAVPGFMNKMPLQDRL